MQEYKFRPFLMNQLMRPVTTGRIVHAQIFAGPEGTGKTEAARHVAQALNCTGAGLKPCGVCPSCLRFRDGNAPELSEVGCEKGNAHILVRQIEALIEEVYRRPDRGVKCVVIREAEKMNPESQNKLLKTLEEPPAYAAFFLITRSLSALLPTIRSRCQLVRFAPLGEKEIEQSLLAAGTDAPLAERIALLSCGSIGRALSLKEDGEYLSDVETLTAMLSRLKTKADIPLIIADLSAFKGRSRRMLEILEISAGELLRARPVNSVARALNKNNIDGVRLMQAVLDCAKKLDSNVTYQYAAEKLLFDLFKASNV